MPIVDNSWEKFYEELKFFLQAEWDHQPDTVIAKYYSNTMNLFHKLMADNRRKAIKLIDDELQNARKRLKEI
jgi:hypothetical protein